ncbi:sigma-54-dependent Fis family transcriptional regulator [Noviherbaspirillum sedimenti]|uniref:Sigma-54-dependent Fis family transcriptional regulator n=1 Tax=Noviherbaspirillum sedimenti TaxID=2320865 RepID=A0A3A3G522_9BURK|nr:sigma-54-dependent Fis family transcriptional regulator [Noviherbaspirillum sedimenti]
MANNAMPHILAFDDASPFATLVESIAGKGLPELQCCERFGRMLGVAPAMRKFYHHVGRVAPTDATVLLLGESGTGKELAALTIHALSPRQKQAFLPVNCGAISPQLIESEIFGHEKGSFTGAERQHKGYFERANGGTLFLDEITEMPPELQVKLLRVLESGSFMRIGSNEEIACDVRVIAASNRDPEQAVAEGRLRLDLYHRLNVFPIYIPPLRERTEDVELLAQHFLDELNVAHDTNKVMTPDALASLSSRNWPGNVRELRNHIQRAYIMADQTIGVTALTPDLAEREASTGLTLAVPVGTSLADVDRKIIFATLQLCDGVKKRAAAILGISLKTLYNRLEEYGFPEREAASSVGESLPSLEESKVRNFPL